LDPELSVLQLPEVWLDLVAASGRAILMPIVDIGDSFSQPINMLTYLYSGGVQMHL